MKQTLKRVAVIYATALFLFLLNGIGWLRLPELLHRVLMDVGVALLAVGAIHVLDHYSLIREVSTEIVERARAMFEKAVSGATTKMTDEVSASVDKAANNIVADVGSKFDTTLRSATATMTADMSAAVDKTAAGIVADMTRGIGSAFAEASEVLQRQVKSIESMEACNLDELYSSREAAASSIYEGIKSSNEVWLMGISLNEFCQEGQGIFSKSWERLINGVREGKKKARLLLIDPYCHGATLRSYGETANKPNAPDRMAGDVKMATELCHDLRKELGDRQNDLSVRVYRMAPTMFLCRLDSGTYVQNYYFWKQRLTGTPSPIFHYKRREQSEAKLCMHSELEEHFKFIWDYASIRLDTLDPTEEGPHILPWGETRGLEWGSNTAAMANVFVDRYRAAVRMQEEIERSKRIWIQGITLRAFFDETKIAQALQRRIKNMKQDESIRIMLLDPDCPEAKIRAFREFQLNSPRQLQFEEFTKSHYQKSKLRRDLRETKDKIEDLERTYHKAGIMVQYQTAPHMFVLITDNAAFVEQYTFGKLRERDPDIEIMLGSDMPLIEYQADLSPIYLRDLKNLRSREPATARELRPLPYPLLVSHFEYAWNQAGGI